MVLVVCVREKFVPVTLLKYEYVPVAMSQVNPPFKLALPETYSSELVVWAAEMLVEVMLLKKLYVPVPFTQDRFMAVPFVT